MNFLKRIHRLKEGRLWKLAFGKRASRQPLKIFISSPRDVPEARDEATRQVWMLMNDPEIARAFEIEILRWEKETPPIVGDTPQATVNKYIGRPSDADIVVCIFGRRFGTDMVLGREHYPSGTYYEFKDAERARRRRRTGKPVILLYRMLKEPHPQESREEAKQAANVEAFFLRFDKFRGRKSLYQGLYEQYWTAEEFGAALFSKLKSVILKEFLHPNVRSWIHSLSNRFGLKIDREDSRAAIIKRVGRDWIDEALQNMTAGFAYPCQIKLCASKSAKQRHAACVSPSQDILKLFDDADHQLLILGPQGSGKTYKLLELTSALLDRAKENHSMPIPVMLNLSSWSAHKEPMDKWLVSELVSVYQLPRSLARRWVDNEMIVLCLDGLDEITVVGTEPSSDQKDEARRRTEHCRRACLQALNEYIEGTGIWLALCCREEEYKELGLKLHTRRGDSATVRIEPLSYKQVKAYLDEEKWELGSLRKAIVRDSTLRKMARKLFLLLSMTIAYNDERGNSVAGILRGGEDGKKARLMDLFSKYVHARHSKADDALREKYRLPKIHKYLKVFADMVEKGGSKHLLVDQLQPAGLPPFYHRRYIARVCLFLILSVIVLVSLPCGLAIGLEWAWAKSSPVVGLQYGLKCFLAVTICCGGIIAAGFASAKAWGFGIACGLVLGATRTIVLALSYDKTWSDALYQGVITSALGILVLVLVMKFRRHARDEIRPLESRKWDTRKAIVGVVTAVVVGVIFVLLLGQALGIGFIITLMPILALAFGYLHTDFEAKIRPNQGIQHSKKIAWQTTLLGAFFGMLSFGVSYGITSGFRAAIINGILGLTLSVVSLEFGAMPVIQHRSLRGVLTAHDLAPSDLVEFLEAACALHLLRRVGGGYMFQHEYLREYFRDALPQLRADTPYSLAEAARQIANKVFKFLIELRPSHRLR
jgi:NACHT domain